MSATESDTQSAEPKADTDPDASIVTSAKPARAIHTLVDCLVDEAVWQVDQDGVSIEVTDPANVAMLMLDVNGDAFPSYDFNKSLRFGMAHERYGPTMEYARLRQDDPVKLTFEGKECELRATRPDQRTQRQTTVFSIDPDSMRTTPDEPGIDLDWWAKPEDPEAFFDAVKGLDTHADHLSVRPESEFGEGIDMILDTEPDADSLGDDSVRFTDAAEWKGDGDPVDKESLFSLDYLKDIAKAIHKAKMDRVTVRWGQEFPVKIRFQHTEWGFDGMYLVAPRLQNDESDGPI